MCRVLAVVLAVADSPRSGAGRVGLLLGGAIEALMPCLGLPKPEVIRSALEVRVGAQCLLHDNNCMCGMCACSARDCSGTCGCLV